MRAKRGNNPEQGKLDSKFKPNDRVWIIHDFYKSVKCEVCQRHNESRQYEIKEAVVVWVTARWHITWGMPVIHYEAKLIRPRGGWSKESYYVNSENMFSTKELAEKAFRHHVAEMKREAKQRKQEEAKCRRERKKKRSQKKA